MKLRKPILLTLIGLGLCAIGVSVYLQYGKPYMREQAVQSQDEKRIADLDALNTSIQAILVASSTVNIGNANTVYISLPSATSTCTDLELPSLPDGWSYHCATSTDLQKTDGTGWLPAALALHSLPIDPLNNADTLNYYAFVTSPAGWEAASTTATTTAATVSTSSPQATSTQPSSAPASAEASERAQQGSGETKYVLTAVLDSKKYLKEKARMDNGTDPIRYELGNKLTLWANADGLLGYWSFSDKPPGTAIDKSKSKNDIVILQNLFAENDCMFISCVSNVETYFQTLAFPNVLHTSKNLEASYKLTFKLTKIPDTSIQFFNPGSNRLDLNIEGKTGSLFVWFTSASESQSLVYKSSKGEYFDNQWHQILISKSPSLISVYVDGRQVGSVATTELSGADQENGFVTIPPGGSINEIALYDHALSDLEAKRVTKLIR